MTDILAAFNGCVRKKKEEWFHSFNIEEKMFYEISYYKNLFVSNMKILNVGFLRSEIIYFLLHCI